MACGNNLYMLHFAAVLCVSVKECTICTVYVWSFAYTCLQFVEHKM